MKMALSGVSSLVLFLSLVTWSVISCKDVSELATERKYPNILFIAVDDLRPELSNYGADQMVTPHFDRLAERGITFTRAYCQQAVCAPSRNSVLTGLRPDAMGIYDLYTFFRTNVPEVVTLPQYFRQHGYHTERMGKIYHLGHGNQDDSLSWSRADYNMGLSRRQLAKVQRGDTVGLESDFPTLHGKKLPFYRSSEHEANMTDAMSADHAVRRLHELRDSTFFLAVGFVKPHLPFVAPKKYWDLYDPAKIRIPDRNNPEGMAPMALANFGELRKYDDVPAQGQLDDDMTRHLIHGYYASVSMIDAQVGKLLNALEELNLAEETIIVLWADHGYKLGDYGNWCKHSNFELDTKVPLFFSVPGMKGGTSTNTLAELVDIYPTLCDLAGIPKPQHLEGQSLLSALEHPETQYEGVALSQYPRGPSLGYDRKSELMGYSMRTDKYRYTRWQKYEHPDQIIDRELYDHANGPLAERNLAKDPSFAKMVSELDTKLDAELAKYLLLRSTAVEVNK